MRAVFHKLTTIAYRGSAELTGNLLMTVLVLSTGIARFGTLHPSIPQAPVKPAEVTVSISAPLPEKPVSEKRTKATPEPALNTAEHRFHPIIVRAANRYHVDPALVKAVI